MLQLTDEELWDLYTKTFSPEMSFYDASEALIKSVKNDDRIRLFEYQISYNERSWYIIIICAVKTVLGCESSPPIPKTA